MATIRIGALTTLFILAAGLGTVAAAPGTRPDPALSATATTDTEGWTRLADALVDYAPVGLPDFDQRQYNWRSADPRRSFTHDGPVAAVDALWWLDARHEPGASPPPAVSDGFDLLGALGPWDDHAPANFRPLVEDLATRSDTNGPRGTSVHPGTCAGDLVRGIREVVDAATDQPALSVTTVDLPNVRQLQDAVANGHPVVLLIGLWQYDTMVGWGRVGGHYVALEGVDVRRGRLRLADPFRNTAGPDGPPSSHDDAAVASHDEWFATPSLRPGPVLRLDGYVDGEEATTLVENFVGHNAIECAVPASSWAPSFALEAQLDMAIVIERVPATPGPTATETADPPPTESPSATPTESSTSTATPPPGSPSPPPTSTEAPATDLPPPPSPLPSASPTHTAGPLTTPTLPGPGSPTATQPPEPTARFTDQPGATPTTVGGHICGVVTDKAGMALSSAEVGLYRDGEPVDVIRTADNGSFCFLDLAPGTYRLRVAAAGCEPAERSVLLAGGREQVAVTVPCAALFEAHLPLLVTRRAP